MTNRQGTILKKCSCQSKRTCRHGWTLRYWADGKQAERTFRDLPGKPGSGKQLAQDFQVALAHGKRAGDITFADKSRGAVRFTDYAQAWIDAHSNAGTRAWMTTTLRKYVAPEVGDVTPLVNGVAPCSVP